MRRLISFMLIGLTLLVVGGCSRDPNVRKQKYLESGKRYFAKQQYREAVIQFSNSLQVDSSFSAAHYELARTYLKMQMWPNAFSELNRTVQLDPNNLAAQVDIGNIYLAAGQLDQAKKQAELVLQKDPNSAIGHALLGNVDQASSDSQSALAELNKAIQLDPKRAESYGNLGLLQSQRGDLAAAEASFKKAVETDPRNPVLVSMLGRFYSSQRRWAEAERQFQHLIELNRDDIASRLQLAHFYLVQNKKTEAEAVVIQAKKDINNSAGHRLLGDYYLQLGEREKALQEYTSLAHEYPKDLGIQHVYIQLLADFGRLDEAMAANEKILKKDPTDTDTLALKGHILIAQHKGAEALQPLEAATKSRPENAGLHYDLALAAAEAGDIRKSEAQLRETVKLNPKFLEAWERLAHISAAKADPAEVERDANAFIAAAPKLPQGYLLRANANLMRQDFKKADADVQTAIDVAPNSALAYTRLGELRLFEKKFAESEKALMKARQLDPKFYEPIPVLVRLYGLQKQPPKATAVVREYIAANPESASGYLQLAVLLLSSNNSAEAEQALLKVRQLDGKNPSAFPLLVVAYRMQSAEDKMNDAYTQWISTSPKDPRPLIDFGAVEQGRGNMKHAEQLFQKALQLQPENPAAANNLAYLLLQEKRDFDQAVSLAQMAHRRLPNDPSISDTLAYAYILKGVPNSAIDLLQDAIKLMPNNPAFHYHLALAYEKSGNKQKARTELEQVIKLDPKYETTAVHDALEKIGRS